jgi:rod shape-determining protein MreC
MLWKFRRELIFLVLLMAGIFFTRHGLPTFHIRREKRPEQPILLERMLKENADLRVMLRMKERSVFKEWVPVEVKRISPWVYPSMVVMEEVSSYNPVGMGIVNARGYLVGRVTGKDGRECCGTTLYHHDSNVSVLVASTGELGILEGGTFPFLTIKFLPQKCRAKEGDMVLTSGLSQLYPAGIPIGRIVKFHRSYSALAMEAVIQPFFFHDDLSNVVLVR